MKLKYRLSLVALGVIVFLIATPILVLYARGFKFDFKDHTLVKTGAFSIQTEPSKAQIFLNGQLQSVTSPANLRFLTPGDYEIKIVKDGYQTWSKRLTVYPQLVTWINRNRDSLVLLSQTPTLKQTYQAGAIVVSSDRSEIAFADPQSNLKILNTNSGNINAKGNLPMLTNLQFQPSFSWQNGSKIYDTVNSLVNYPQLLKDLQKAQLIASNGDYTVYLLNNNLYSLNSGNPVLIDKNVASITLDGSTVWYLQKSLLKQADLTSNQSSVVNNAVPTYSHAQLIRAKNQLYAILDSKLYVLNDTFQQIYSNATFASFDPASNLLLLSNDFEILTYDPNKNQTELIVRSSSPIKNPILNWTSNYIFYQNENKIRAVELDERDQRNNFMLLDASGISNFAVSKDGRSLYTISPNAIKQYTIR